VPFTDIGEVAGRAGTADDPTIKTGRIVGR
jgi:hypothetical protein